MDRRTLRGLFASLITPFDKNENMDEEQFRELVRGLVGRVDALVICASPGEFEYLDLEERVKLFDICVEEAGGRAPVIAGVGAPGTRMAQELVCQAEQVGVDACLISAPYFLRPSDKGMQQHFVEVASNTSLPLIVYNPRQGSDGRIPRRVLEDLSRIGNIIGLADASGDLSYLMEVDEKTEGRLAIMNANEEVALPALTIGCEGLMLGSAQLYPEIWKDMMTALDHQDLQTARKVQRDLQKLSRLFTRYGESVPLKAALRYLGKNVGRSRGPLKEGGVILHEDREEIRLELEKLGLLPPSMTKMDEMPLGSRFSDIGMTEEDMAANDVMVGNSSIGSGLEKVVVDVVAGLKNGRVGELFASQIVYLKRGKEALPSVLEPNLSARPSCLIVPAVELKNLRQASIMYGPAQAAIAKAIADKVKEGVIPRAMVDDHVMLTKAYVDPNALDRGVLYDNFYIATSGAIDMAFGGVL